MFESFIMKHSKAKRSKVFLTSVRKHSPKPAGCWKHPQSNLIMTIGKSWKWGKVKENSFKIKGEKLFSGGHLHRKLLKCDSPNVYMQLWKYANPSKSYKQKEVKYFCNQHVAFSVCFMRWKSDFNKQRSQRALGWLIETIQCVFLYYNLKYERKWSKVLHKKKDNLSLLQYLGKLCIWKQKIFKWYCWIQNHSCELL